MTFRSPGVTPSSFFMSRIAPIFVSYHTGGRYERHSQELVDTLDKFGLEHYVLRMPDSGDWCVNCSIKPTVVRLAMARHPGRAVVYLDADARVRKMPELFFEISPDVDLARHLLGGGELLSGTLYFGATGGAAELITMWEQACADAPGIWDQVHLQCIVESGRRWNILDIPESYVYIFDRATVPKEQVVIEHFQASRG